MTDEINDYKADAEVTPRRRGRPAKAAAPVAPAVEPEVEAVSAPVAVEEPVVKVEPVSDTYISPQVRLEIEAGRRALGLA